MEWITKCGHHQESPTYETLVVTKGEQKIVAIFEGVYSGTVAEGYEIIFREQEKFDFSVLRKVPKRD